MDSKDSRITNPNVTTKKLLIVLIGLFISLFGLYGCDHSIVTLNGEKISDSEFNKQLALVKFQNPGTDYSKLTPEQQKELHTYVLNNYVVQKLALNDAVNNKNIVVSDGDSVAIAKPFITAYGNAGNVIAEAKKFGLTEKDIDDFFFNEAMMNAYQASLVATTTPSKTVLKKYYQEHKDSFKTETEIHAAHILVATQTEAAKIEQELKNGKDFATLAAQKSTDKGSKTKGGDLGWAQPSVYVPEFTAALMKLRDGEVSQPVKTQYGYHIIKRLELKKGQLMSLEEAATTAVSEENKRTKLFDAWLKDAKATAYAKRVLSLIHSAKIKWGSSEDEKAFNEALLNRTQTSGSSSSGSTNNKLVPAPTQN